MNNTVDEQPIESDFPFAEIRQESGDMFDTAEEAMKFTSYDDSHIWSVGDCDDEEYGGERYGFAMYGPSHHYINILGFIATKERHDGDTYFTECYSMGRVESYFPEEEDDG